MTSSLTASERLRWKRSACWIYNMVVIVDLKNSLSGVVEMDTWMKSVKERNRSKKVEVTVLDNSSISWSVLRGIPTWGHSTLCFLRLVSFPLCCTLPHHYRSLWSSPTYFFNYRYIVLPPPHIHTCTHLLYTCQIVNSTKLGWFCFGSSLYS